MRSYTIHEPDDVVPDLLARADDLVFIKEGFAWLALFFAPLWLIYHRLWLVLLGFILVFAALGAALGALGVDATAKAWVSMLMVIVFAYEANDLRRWYLGLRGYHMAAMVSGRNRVDCERRFFNMWLARVKTSVKQTSQPAIATKAAK